MWCFFVSERPAGMIISLRIILKLDADVIFTICPQEESFLWTQVGFLQGRSLTPVTMIVLSSASSGSPWT